MWLSLAPGSSGGTSKNPAPRPDFQRSPASPSSCWFLSNMQLEVLLVPQLKLSKLVISQHESVFYVTPACTAPNPSWARSALTANLRLFIPAADNFNPLIVAQQAPPCCSWGVSRPQWGSPGAVGTKAGRKLGWRMELHSQWARCRACPQHKCLIMGLFGWFFFQLPETASVLSMALPEKKPKRKFSCKCGRKRRHWFDGSHLLFVFCRHLGWWLQFTWYTASPWSILKSGT